MDNKEKMLNEIESLADDAVVIKKEVHDHHVKRSVRPLKFEVSDDEPIALNVNLIRYINTKDFTYQDLIDFCIAKENGDEVIGKRSANNIISGLKERRKIRSDTIDLLCEFLNVDLIIEEKDF